MGRDRKTKPTNNPNDKAAQNEDSVKWNSDPSEGAKPLPGTEPLIGPEDVPDFTKG